MKTPEELAREAATLHVGELPITYVLIERACLSAINAVLAQEREQSRNRLSKLVIDLDEYWSFDNAQQHTHSWHDKQDFMERLRAELNRIAP